MPYASSAALSTSPVEGGIEITELDYLNAIQHLSNGGLIFIEQGALILAIKPEQKPGHHPPERINGEWHHEPLPEPEAVEPGPDPMGASINALTPGTEANEVFSWMALQGLSNVAAATARNDINMNLLGLPSLWLSEGNGRLMASTGLDTAFAMLWDAVDSIPDGYQDIVAAWRSEYHLTAG